MTQVYDLTDENPFMLFDSENIILSSYEIKVFQREDYTLRILIGNQLGVKEIIQDYNYIKKIID